MDTPSTIPAARLSCAWRRPPTRSQAHEFVGYCGREDVSPHDLEGALHRRGARIEPYPLDTAVRWTFADGSVLRVWTTGRSLQRPLVGLETRDGAELVQRWWIWWKGLWSCAERMLETAPEIEFLPSSPPDRRDDDDFDAYRILVDGRRVAELVFDFEVRCWFLEAGSLLPLGNSTWLPYAAPRAQAKVRCLIAQALLWRHSHANLTGP